MVKVSKVKPKPRAFVSKTKVEQAPAILSDQRGKRRSPGDKSTPEISSSTAKRGSRQSVTRKQRFRPGARALMEIRKYQKSTKLLIPRLPFQRLVKEIIMESIIPLLQPFRIERKALEALQESAEMYMVQFFEESVTCAIHAKRVTVLANDIQHVRRIRGYSDPAH